MTNPTEPAEMTGIEYTLAEIEQAIERTNPFDDWEDDPAEMSGDTLALYRILARFRALVREVRAEQDGEPTDDSAQVPTNPDRRCRDCGATHNLKMLVDPLSAVYRQWECWDGCTGSTR